jgi:hypothetical protein
MAAAGNPFGTLEYDNVSVVILGKFNPAIFHPQWFARFNLLGPTETEGAKLEVSHPDISLFTAGWAKVQVTDDKAIFETSDPTKKYEVRDLALGTFQILEHTPLRAFGINSVRHYKIENEETWHAIGDYFAPKDAWLGLFDDDGHRPGLHGLSILGSRKGCNAHRIQLQLGPSHPERIKAGVFIKINQHYELPQADEDDNETNVGLEQFSEWIQGDWEDFIKYSEKVSSHLWNEFSNSRARN